ncbi:hypothetical protein CEXT_51931 [Caerostris extrusa]|uniref:Uncharacterized protein n=1 Tax=Caerostris extrusa TaxID=172846 RepID=A0AAV4P6U2_CAEEX|nr:hypothetical protein CEXT_51931 [Caerostris extrusa]
MRYLDLRNAVREEGRFVALGTQRCRGCTAVVPEPISEHQVIFCYIGQISRCSACDRYRRQLPSRGFNRLNRSIIIACKAEASPPEMAKCAKKKDEEMTPSKMFVESNRAQKFPKALLRKYFLAAASLHKNFSHQPPCTDIAFFLPLTLLAKRETCMVMKEL